jgi:hypothetical protein
MFVMCYISNSISPQIPCETVGICYLNLLYPQVEYYLLMTETSCLYYAPIFVNKFISSISQF